MEKNNTTPASPIVTEVPVNGPQKGEEIPIDVVVAPVVTEKQPSVDGEDAEGGPIKGEPSVVVRPYQARGGLNLNERPPPSDDDEMQEAAEGDQGGDSDATLSDMSLDSSEEEPPNVTLIRCTRQGCGQYCLTQRDYIEHVRRSHTRLRHRAEPFSILDLNVFPPEYIPGWI
ncbi:OLC1v1010547C1 [Oldenlandia corymbosa var. corymbosa]|uniref:OLC1v1010547C1 n=1 Tax=Oldenlandia corymbosa var. corymbosa TaxID=529605 RepID=A0AAV1DRM7_OLDCO|nr:OLC1v1010547C1 [Oldenlandia corymbosa var. corymbosa]